MPAFSSEGEEPSWSSSSESVNVCCGSVAIGGSNVSSPCSIASLSPLSTSPTGTLQRNNGRRRVVVSSNGGQREEEENGDHVAFTPIVVGSRCQSPQIPLLPEEDSFFSSYLTKIIGWYPCFLLRIVKSIVVGIFPLVWRQILVAIPTFYLSMWIWIFSQLFVRLPVAVFNSALSLVVATPTTTTPTTTPTTEKLRKKKRTVLISGGGTIQALHLARNFYRAGARVIVCEIEGSFAPARFSTAVAKFYTVPKPTSDQQQHYVRALCEIVEKEEASYYVPVCSSTSAYFDAVAKPHLELLGCSCFCPGIKEVWALDDTLEMLKRCDASNIPTPMYHEVAQKEEVCSLYDAGGNLLNGKYVMTSVGPSGLRERNKTILPISRNELKLSQEISRHRPWVVVQDVGGEHYVTCTTVKRSQVVANVTCRYDADSNGPIPIEVEEIDRWLNNFFAKIQLLRPIDCHVSFEFVKQKTKTGRNGDLVLLPLSSRICVSLPYVCYTDDHPRLLWKQCRHFSRQSSGVGFSSVNDDDGVVNAKSGALFFNGVVESVRKRFVGVGGGGSGERGGTKVLDKREALFVIWDPLPYCAYYHMQLPFKNVIGFVQRRRGSFPQPVAAPVS